MITLESLLTSPQAFGLTTATAVQRAICRVADGQPLGRLAHDRDVLDAFAVQAWTDIPAPAELLVLSGIRTGKSLLAAALAVRATQVVDVSRLGPGETPRVSVLSLTTDLGRVVFDHIRGNVLERPLLRALLVDEPLADSLMLRHPSGRPIEIKVVAGSRAASSLVARWCAGFIADEAPRMVGSEDGVVNLDDARNAVIGRLLPGAQIVEIGSPWAPFGPVYELVQAHLGKPSERLVVVRAPAHHLNPGHWTLVRRTKLRLTDPEAYKTDVEAEFADPAATLFPDELVKACTRQTGDLDAAPGVHYTAAMDPATRGNSWTLVVGHQEGERFIVDLARQWTGSRFLPLSPAKVLREMASVLSPYGVTTVLTDQWSVDANRDLASDAGLYLSEVTVTSADKLDRFESLRTWMLASRIELPAERQLLDDLKRVRKRVTQSGATIELPKTADGRHCDYAPALALLVPSGMRGAVPYTPGHHTVSDRDGRTDASRPGSKVIMPDGRIVQLRRY